MSTTVTPYSTEYQYYTLHHTIHYTTYYHYHLLPYHLLSKPSLLLDWLRFRLGCLLLSEEFISRVIISDIPKVLRHGNNERSNHQYGQEGSVFSLFTLGFLGRFEGGFRVVNRLGGVKDVD